MQALLADNWAELVGYTLLGIGCALLFVVDLAAMRLPNVIIGPMYLLLLTALGVATLLTGDPIRLLKALGCGAAMMGIYLVMALIRRGQLGMGDVKFGGVLGLFLGWLGWGEALLGMLAAFILSARGRPGHDVVLEADPKAHVPVRPLHGRRCHRRRSRRFQFPRDLRTRHDAQDHHRIYHCRRAGRVVRLRAHRGNDSDPGSSPDSTCEQAQAPEKTTCTKVHAGLQAVPAAASGLRLP